MHAFCPETLTARASRTILSRDCPFCHASEALIIVGARASSLLSVVLGQTFASRHNDDAGGQAESAANGKSAGAQKVIAFSDNVQDAAHRAGFFSARTWQNSVRTAVAQTVAEHDGIALSDLPPKVARWWRDAPQVALAKPPATLVRSCVRGRLTATVGRNDASAPHERRVQ